MLPYLNDHRVGGAIVFPAAAHLEAALEAAQVLAPGKSARLAEVSFLQALYLSETESQDLQLVLRKILGKADSFSFSLMGRLAGGIDEWIEHSTGTIHIEEAAASERLAEALPVREEPSRQGFGEEHYRKARRSGTQYGAAFQLVESFESGSHSDKPFATTKIRLHSDHRQTGYAVHPALLDGCFQAIMHLRPENAGMSADDVYLPLTVRGLKIFGSPSEYPVGEDARLITEAHFSSVDADAATMDVELRLRTEAGKLLAVVEAMTVQRVKTRAGENVTDNLFAMSWKPLRALPAPTPGGSAGAHWLIFADSGIGCEAGTAGESLSYAAALARRHASLAGRCSLVWQGQRFRPLGAGERRLSLLGADEYEMPAGDNTALDALFSSVSAEAGRIAAIIDLWTLQKDPSAGGKDAILEAQTTGTKFIPTIVQSVTRAGWTNSPRLWLATQGTQNLPDAPPSANLAGSTVWGMGAVVSREHPELRPSLIDFGAPDHHGPNPAEIENCVRLLMDERTRGGSNAPVREDRVALRGEAVFAG